MSDQWTWENARSKRSWSIFSCVFWNQSEHKTNKTSSFGLSSQHTVVHSFPLRTPASSNLRIWMQQLKFPYPIFPGRKRTSLVELDETLKSLESIQSSKSSESHHMLLVKKTFNSWQLWQPNRNSVRYVQRTSDAETGNTSPTEWHLEMEGLSCGIDCLAMVG